MLIIWVIKLCNKKHAVHGGRGGFRVSAAMVTQKIQTKGNAQCHKISKWIQWIVIKQPKITPSELLLFFTIIAWDNNYISLFLTIISLLPSWVHNTWHWSDMFVGSDNWWKETSSHPHFTRRRTTLEHFGQLNNLSSPRFGWNIALAKQKNKCAYFANWIYEL